MLLVVKLHARSMRFTAQAVKLPRLTPAQA